MQNNNVHLIGTVCSPFEYSHSVCGEDFYKVFVSSLRNSGAADVLPVMVSARTVDVKQNMTSYRIEVLGSLRSYNRHEEGRSVLILYIWADMFKETDLFDCNTIEIDGYLCRTPKYRTTPLGREISDLLIAVNRQYSKSDYMPAVAWGRNAKFISNFDAGARIIAMGRIQSRGYIKAINGNLEERTAYEVSVIRLFDEGNDYEQREAGKQGEILQ